MAPRPSRSTPARRTTHHLQVLSSGFCVLSSARSDPRSQDPEPPTSVHYSHIFTTVSRDRLPAAHQLDEFGPVTEPVLAQPFPGELEHLAGVAGPLVFAV